ncbi:transcription termination factor MTERF4, chloroplastic-like [Mercurialis annua]|uniref:transcription termination factor MTERF4, chloroplastic-like n=1 Tax=Mercurialis annua TaxID=3986 RepID=UPI002160428E|nr:transcription termination factor MTERF4, chloroplastic-like [Mercurialis annua]
MAKTQLKNLVFHIQKRFFTSTPTPPSSSSTVEFLKNSCGLSLKSAISVTQRLHLEEKNQKNIQSVLEILKAHSFTDTQLTKLIEKRPEILLSKVKENIQPKLEYLENQGFAGKLLPELILLNPVILRRALDSHIKPSFEFLKSVLGSNGSVVASVKRSSWLLTFNVKGVMLPNIEFLEKGGVPALHIERLLRLQPRAIMQKHDRVVQAFNSVKEKGVEPKSPMFVHAIRVMLSMSDVTWKNKIEVMKSLGWNYEDIIGAFARHPLCLACSEKKLRNAMDFYLNTMKLEPKVVISYPRFLMYAIETRLRPRYNVLKALESKNLIKGHKKIEWLLTLNEKAFLQRYVMKYADEFPGMMEIYLAALEVKKIGA